MGHGQPHAGHTPARRPMTLAGPRDAAPVWQLCCSGLRFPRVDMALVFETSVSGMSSYAWPRISEDTWGFFRQGVS